jgi:signal transduction histidine kinase
VFSLVLVEDVGDRRRAAEALARRAALLQLMQNVSSAANRAGSLHEVLREALEHTCAYTGWPVGHVFERDADGTLATSGIWRVTEPERFAGLRAATEGIRLRDGEGVVGRVAATGQPSWVEDVHGEPGFVRARLAAELGVRGAVAWPIRAEGRVVAVAEFFSEHPEHPDPELLELLGNLGTQLGVVVERERIAERLRESENRFSRILDAVPAGVLVREASGAVLYANAAAERLLGRPPQPQVSLESASADYRLRVAATGQPYPAARLPMMQALAGRAASADDVEVEVAGRRVPLHVEAAPIFGEDGRVAYAVAAFVDVSEMRALDRALREHARELERSNRELEEFAYVASHDLQEPLRKIRAFGGRLAEGWSGALGVEGSDYLARMLGAAERMQRLIQDLLLYSRVSRRPAAPARVELSAVLEEVLLDLEGRLRETGGTVDAGPLPAVRADATAMGQLLQNLVANALKFHRPGVPPAVRVRAAPAPGGMVRVVVEDEGIGFEPGQAERVFLPFQRLHGRAAYEGTGMGLAICRRIAETAGGTIEARAEPGRGAAFTVTLPAWDGDEGR